MVATVNLQQRLKKLGGSTGMRRLWVVYSKGAGAVRTQDGQTFCSLDEAKAGLNIPDTDKVIVVTYVKAGGDV